MFEYRVEASQYERLPQPSHPSIPITERVDELKLIMKNATTDKKMVWSMFQPMEQIFHKFGYTHGRGSKVNTSVTFKYADSTAAEASRMIHQGFHHYPMRFQEISQVKRI